jgi:hypothetical protein
MSNQKKLGLVQSRGLGDIIISLPIAHYYHQEGYHVHWPIVDAWVPQMERAASWVKWIPISPDKGPFFYDVPMQRLRNFKVDEVICLYQALTGHPEFSSEVYFQHTKFDQYKYIKAGVPFSRKWRLSECITRDAAREQALYDRVVAQEQYAVIHLEGSDHRARFDTSVIPRDWQIIEIDTQTDSVFDWLKILEGAQSLILVDSVFANLVDQLDIGEDRYFIPRSHIGLTPVQGGVWTWLQP